MKRKRKEKEKKAQTLNWAGPQYKILYRGTRCAAIRAARGRHIGFPVLTSCATSAAR
jgi:hypothetical protein